MRKFRPLLVMTPDWNRHSFVSVRFSMKLIDYMKDAETGKKLKGTKQKQDADMIFTIVYQGSRWLVAAIDDDSGSLDLAMKKNQLDREHLQQMKESQPGSQAASPDFSQSSPNTEPKETVVGISPNPDDEGNPEYNSQGPPKKTE